MHKKPISHYVKKNIENAIADTKKLAKMQGKSEAEIKKIVSETKKIAEDLA